MNLITKIYDGSISISIIGLGYVGLPTAVAFAKKGISVIGLDLDKSKIDNLNNGISPINDEYLKNEIPFVIGNKRLVVTTDYKYAIENSDIVIMIMPTPVNEAKEPDLQFIETSGKSISNYLKKNQLIILESTVYPGLTEEVLLPILEKSGLKTPEDFGLAYCPERFNPGDKNHTVEKVVRVIGANTPKWGKIALELYSLIQDTFPTVDIKTAEAAKVIENTQRDLNIALMNEIALICERLNIDVKDVLEAAATKWNFVKYFPGPGVGGHCLPHDPYYLVKKAKEHGYYPQVILAGRKVNDDMPLHVVELLTRALNYCKKPIKKSKIIILGATYKKDIDDLRTSPTEILVNKLKQFEADIYIFEPNVNQKKIFGCASLQTLDENVLSEVDALIFMVAHEQFKDITPSFLKQSIKNKERIVIIDGIRQLDGYKMKDLGFIYFGIGAGNINSNYY